MCACGSASADPESKEQVHGHVLNDFAKDEYPWVDAVLEAISEIG